MLMYKCIFERGTWHYNKLFIHSYFAAYHFQIKTIQNYDLFGVNSKGSKVLAVWTSTSNLWPSIVGGWSIAVANWSMQCAIVVTNLSDPRSEPWNPWCSCGWDNCCSSHWRKGPGSSVKRERDKMFSIRSGIRLVGSGAAKGEQFVGINICVLQIFFLSLWYTWYNGPYLVYHYWIF